MEKDTICERCKKNKATIDFAEGALAVSHGFVEHLCQECFDKMQKEHPLYKLAYKQGQKDLSDYYFKGMKNPMIIQGEHAKKVIKELDNKKKDKK